MSGVDPRVAAAAEAIYAAVCRRAGPDYSPASWKDITWSQRDALFDDARAAVAAADAVSGAPDRRCDVHHFSGEGVCVVCGVTRAHLMYAGSAVSGGEDRPFTLAFDPPRERDWDSYGAVPTTPEALGALRGLAIVPTANGGLQVEMHAGGVEIEAEFDEHGRFIDGSFPPVSGVGEDREDEIRLLRAERDSWYGTAEQLTVERDRLAAELEELRREH